MAKDLPRNYFGGGGVDKLELFFRRFETVFSKICAHRERYRNLLAGIFEIRTFFWQHRVSIVTGLNIDFLFYFIFSFAP